MKGTRSALAVLVAALSMLACGDDGGGSGGSGGGPASGEAAVTIQTVAALEPITSDLVDAYRRQGGGPAEVEVVTQPQLTQAVGAGGTAIVPGAWLGGINAPTTVLGRNLAVIVVPAGNPSQVHGVEAFGAGAGLSTVACGPDSPVGNFAALILGRAGVLAPVDARPGCVADALARVESGELSAALVFRSGFEMPEGVDVVEIPENLNIVMDLHYAAGDAPAAADFGTFLSSDAAVQLLTSQGYLP